MRHALKRASAHAPLRARARAGRQRGIAMIEVLVAIVLLGIGVLGTIGLQGRSYSALADTGLRAEATMAADKLIGTMTTDQANLGDYALTAGGTPSAVLRPWYEDTRARIPGAGITVAVVAPTPTTAGKVTVTISWLRKRGSGAVTDAQNTNTHRVTAFIAAAT